MPTPPPWWRKGATSKEETATGGENAGSPSVRRWLAMSETRRGVSIPLRYSKKPNPWGSSHSP